MNFNSTIAIVVFMLLCSCRPMSVEPLQKEVNVITNRWVPDKRVGICKLQLEGTGNNQLILRGETMFPNAKNEALQLLKNKGITVTDSVRILPDSVSIQKVWGVVSLSVANLRSGPEHSSEMVSQAIMGTPVRILKQTDGWFLIQTPDRYIAWTNQYAIQTMSNSEISDWRNSNRIIYTETYGTAYKDIQKSIVLCDLVLGAIVTKVTDHKDITQILLPDGRAGFVSKQNWLGFKPWKDSVSLVSDRMISMGERLLGFPYLWGGTSSKGIDCSGFVKTVCFLNGVVLERDASQQAKHGKILEINQGYGNFQKGDLLFFGNKNPYKVTHVGIYIGDSEVIHSSGFVHISSLDKSRENFSDVLSSGLIGARRIIGISPEQGLLPIRQHNWY